MSKDSSFSSKDLQQLNLSVIELFKKETEYQYKFASSNTDVGITRYEIQVNGVVVNIVNSLETAAHYKTPERKNKLKVYELLSGGRKICVMTH